MPSKFRKAIAAVKDQTSISLAKVGGTESSTLEVAILRATTHDEEVPIDERHVTEVLRLVSSNRSYAGSCARAIGRRIGRTKSWVVAVKSLMLVLRIFQDGDPHFPKEVLHAMKRGYKILNLSSFRDDSSTSCPWDFTAFVRTFSLYLDERLDCFVTGKLQRRTSYATLSSMSSSPSAYANRIRKEPVVRDMKPAVLLDRISHWQRLLDRAVATRPTGAAKTNQLVHTCLYSIVQESFDLYRDISDGLALLLDSFFHLHYTNCVSAFQTCVRASKQFQELNSFYQLCKTIGVGTTSEYPSVQGVSQELIETLQEFLKDQSSFPVSSCRSPVLPPLPPHLLSPRDSEFGSVRRSEFSERERAVSEFGGSQCPSLEDLISADSAFSPERYSDLVGEKTPATQLEDYYSANDTSSVISDSTDTRGLNTVLDLLSSPPKLLQDQAQNLNFEPNKLSFESNNDESSKGVESWELVLFEPSPQNTTETNDHNHDNLANSTSNNNNNNNSGFELDWFSSFDAPTAKVDSNATTNNSVSTSLAWPGSSDYNYNPFLQDYDEGNNQFFGGFDPNQASVSSSSNHNFSLSGFPAELGTQTDQAQFGNNNGNSFGVFPPNGFTSDFGMVHNNGNIEHNPTFQAESGNYNGNSLGAISPHHSFSSGVGVANNNAYAGQIPTIQPEFGSHNANSYNCFPPHSFSIGMGDGNNNGYGGQNPTFGAEFLNNDITNFEGYSQHGNREGQTPTYEAEIGQNGCSFGGFSADFAPTFHSEYGNRTSIDDSEKVNNSKNGEDFTDLFSSLSLNTYQGDFGQTSSPTYTSNHNRRASLPTLGHTRFGQGDVSSTSSPFVDDYGISRASFTPMSPAQSSTENNTMTIGINEFNPMSAIVPYGQTQGNEHHELFYSVPTFQATSSDMDQSIGVHYGNDLFGSSSNNGQDMDGCLDQQSVLHQQQLWLENQRKIMSRHWT